MLSFSKISLTTERTIGLVSSYDAIPYRNQSSLPKTPKLKGINL